MKNSRSSNSETAMQAFSLCALFCGATMVLHSCVCRIQVLGPGCSMSLAIACVLVLLLFVLVLLLLSFAL